MPNCFQLIRDGSPQPLVQIDNAICQYLDVPADDHKYVAGWYDYVGFGLAVGMGFGRIADLCKADRDWIMLRICHFLAEHYTSDAWVEIGRR